MIAYKWTIKKDNKYFSLMNFNIYPSLKNLQCKPYELNKIYSDYIKDLRPINLQHNLNIAGFHFWKEPKSGHLWKRFNNCLNHYKQPEINAILKCRINNEDIIIEDKERIVAKRFKILEEIKCIH